jgi:hypothetical protein
MFEAYKVAVRISLINHVSGALSGLAKDFAKTDAQALALQKRIDSIKSGLKGGIIATGAGLALAGMFKPAIDDAMKFERAMLRLKDIGGMNPRFLSQIRGEALSGKYRGIDATETVDLFRDLHAAFGNAKDAHEFLPLFAGVARVTQGKYGKSSISGEADVKALGQVAERRFGTKSPAAMESVLDLAMKMQNASGGAVTPTDLRAFMARLGAMQMGMSNEGIMKMWALMQEQGGSKAGTALNSALQNLVNGRGTEGSGFVLRKIGWVDDNANQKHLKEIYGENWGKHLNKVTANSLVDVAMAKKDFIGWVEAVGLPKISKYLDKQGITDLQMRQDETTSLLAQALSNRLGADSSALIATQLPRILKDYNLAVDSQGARGSIASYDASPMAKFQRLRADYDTAMINLGLAALPVLIPMVNRLATAFKSFNDYAQKSPATVKQVAKGLLGLSAALVGFGTLTLVVNGIKALGLALSFAGVGGVGGAAGIKGIAAAIGSVGTTGTLLFGLAALGLAVYGITKGLEAVGGDGVHDEKNHPGMRFIRHGRGANNGEWVRDLTVSQEHFGQHLTRNGRWSRWENDIQTVNPTKSYPDFNVTVVSKLNELEVARAVTRVQAKEASKPTSGRTDFDPRMQLIPIGMKALR